MTTARTALAALVGAAVVAVLAACGSSPTFFDEPQRSNDQISRPPAHVDAASTRLLYESAELRVLVGKPTDHDDGLCVLLEQAGEVAAGCASSMSSFYTHGVSVGTPDYIVKLVPDGFSADDGAKLVAPHVLIRKK